jgi:hypothetical protein
LNRPDLADSLVSAVRQIRRAQVQGGEPAFGVRSNQNSSQSRLSDRLSEADLGHLVAAFAAGTTKRELAARYDISDSSVKRLIRQHGASKPSGALSSDGDGRVSRTRFHGESRRALDPVRQDSQPRVPPMTSPQDMTAR